MFSSALSWGALGRTFLACCRFLPVTCVIAACGLPLYAQALPFVPVEGLSDAHWKALEQRIRDAQAGRPGRAINILQLGDSHTAGEYLSGRMRQHFQALFGNGGVGMLPPGNIKDHPFFQARILASAQWNATRVKDAQASPLGLGGYAGYALSPYQTIMYELPKSASVSRLYVYSKGAGSPESLFKFYEDGNELPPVRAPRSTRDGRTVFDLEGAPSRLTILAKRAEPDFELLGLTVAGAKSGATYSSIGVIGATLDVLKNWDSDTTRNQIRDYAPALLILAFGTNDVANPDFSRDRFQDALTYTADWVRRNAPDAAVLLVMPPRAPGFRPRSMQNLESARLTMRMAARQYHWRVWDWSVLTDSNCIASCATPDSVAFFGQDGIHLTRLGYETTADSLYQAIMTSGKHF